MTIIGYPLLVGAISFFFFFLILEVEREIHEEMVNLDL